MNLVKVSPKGQIVIPIGLRAKYDIAPGDKVDVRDSDGKILIFPLPKDVIKKARGMLKGSTSLTQTLLEERAKEREQEERVIFQTLPGKTGGSDING